ncbi:uncharacterized protein Z518_07873 [Rhinocladiella mackenziei CBS 650.93]|uniref:Uncharacterized protein n=1 Tax=Rhinocladiella mackenziei CBS 650.93 TaxID=1442369 RepID=A0A0D2I7W7_9EURO|nr:uncharacterized protein Z518_07873 [Rhinocladiella mackenziei CBS 650.93]KIX01934.1 hypothetical protein Z518_07873 [Rhinocladiella mackenziei CBS 650.93]
MSADLYAAFTAEKDDAATTEKVITSTNAVANASASGVTFQPSVQAWSTPQRKFQVDKESPPWKLDPEDKDVLFDAEEADLEDDFGDFETVGSGSKINSEVNVFPEEHRNRVAEQVGPSVSTSPVRDLLGLDNNIPPPAGSRTDLYQSNNERPIPTMNITKQEKPEASWDEDWGDFEQTHTEEPYQSDLLNLQLNNKPRVGVETMENEPDDDWEPFEDGMPEPNPHDTGLKASTNAWKECQRGVSTRAPATAVFERPMNIPPPSSLLQLLSSVFEALHRSNAEKTKPKSELADTILVVYRTASRIVAGRSMRWKRDTILAQSVRIGQAGKRGGMKLASVNKSENAREERDSEEMIHDWSKHVYEFNNILAQAEFPPHRMKISTSPSLKILKQSSTIDSSKQCAVCGLKRNERLVDVDIDAEDLFGEFWTEHWGHNDCHNFWYSFKGLLGQR